MDSVMSLSGYEENCERNGATTVFLTLSTITLAFATILVPLRIYTRIYIVQSIWWDDVSIAVSYALLVPYFGLLWRMVDRGLGRRTTCVERDNIKDFIELELVTEFFQIICTMFSRLSVALFVGRLFAVTRKARIFLYSYTGFMCISMILTAILTFTVCYPVKAIWHVQPGSLTNCSSATGVHFRDYYNGAVGTLSDFILAMIPLYFLHRLQLDWQSKLGLGAMMGIGLVPMGTCLARTIVMGYTNDYEPLGSFAIVVLLGGVEASMLIVCATIPTLRQLIGHKRTLYRPVSWKIFCKTPSTISGTTTPKTQNIPQTWSVSSFTQFISRATTRPQSNDSSRSDPTGNNASEAVVAM